MPRAGGATAAWPTDAPTTVETFTVEELPDPVLNPPLLLLTEVCVLGSHYVELL